MVDRHKKPRHRRYITDPVFNAQLYYFTSWLREHIEQTPFTLTPTRELHEHYAKWWKDHRPLEAAHVEPFSVTVFGLQLTKIFGLSVRKRIQGRWAILRPLSIKPVYT